MNADRIHASFARQSMMRTLGATLVELGDGFAVIEAPILPGSCQQHGYGHAGLTFSLGDTAAGYAALTTMDDDQEVLTVEMKINLLRPARGETLIARGEVVNPGRRITIVRASVRARSGTTEREVALLQGTMIPA